MRGVACFACCPMCRAHFPGSGDFCPVRLRVFVLAPLVCVAPVCGRCGVFPRVCASWPSRCFDAPRVLACVSQALRVHSWCCARFLGLQHPVAVLFGRFFCAVVVAGGVPLWRASWPRIRAPCFVRSGCSRCAGRISCRRGAFPYRVLCTPGFTTRLRGARRDRPRARLMVPAASSFCGGGAGLAPCCTRSGSRCGVVPGGSLGHWCRVACTTVV